MDPKTVFTKDDLRSIDPKFSAPGSHISIRGTGARRICTGTIWKARDDSLDARQGDHDSPVGRPASESAATSRGVDGWWLDAAPDTEIDRILRETIVDPVGPEFMAPQGRSSDGSQKTQGGGRQPA
jgi:hypothetical protein